MFSTAVQPSIVSLFSSTGSHPLQLFSVHTDQNLVADSVIHLMHDHHCTPPPEEPALLIKSPALLRADDPENDSNLGYELDQTVLHIQSPDIKRTFIQCPKRSASTDGSIRPPVDLGLKHPWLHLQVRNLGREWSFEVGIVDRAGVALAVRCSTFQKRPRLVHPSGSNGPLLLHLPLSFPSRSSYNLTAWSTISLHLPPILKQASTLLLSTQHQQGDQDDSDNDSTAEPGMSHVAQYLPHSRYSHVSYIKIYATCRLRRIWFSEGGPSQRTPWELELYAGAS
ncbi:hypothetical protein HGRIS_011310 [Hohenbuehelia grisea]|uniref:CFA20 domain-containing protein n=1 Tax=Hohenbuehelia grisea TaxID=104357 RepID=A0ABR3JVM0_9AGAR